MAQTLYGNAASLATMLGGGGHGHIGIIMRQPLYATLNVTTPYVAPVDRGVLPTILVAATSPTRERIRT
jgi:hypothetical protein